MPPSPLTFLVEPPPVWYLGSSYQSTMAISSSPVLPSPPSEPSDQSETPQLLIPKATRVTVPEDHPRDTLVSDDESESDTYVDEGPYMTPDFNRLAERLLNYKRHSEPWEEQQVEIKESEIEVRFENTEQEVWVGVLESEWAKDLSERIQDIEQREENLERRECELSTMRKMVDRREEAVSKRERELQLREQEIVSQESRHRETRLREEKTRGELETQRQTIERREVAVVEQEKGLQVREQKIIALEMYMKCKNQGIKQREEKVRVQEENLNTFKTELMNREREMMKQVDLKEEQLDRGVEQCLIWIAELDQQDDSSQARHEEEKRMSKDQQKEEAVRRDGGIPVRKYEGLGEEEKKINFQRVQLREKEEKLANQSRDIESRYSRLQRKETTFAKELAFARHCLRSAGQLKTYGHHSTPRKFILPRDSEEDEHTSSSEVIVTQRARTVRKRLTASGIRSSGRFLDGANGFSINADTITMIAR